MSALQALSFGSHWVNVYLCMLILRVKKTVFSEFILVNAAIAAHSLDRSLTNVFFEPT